MIMEYFGLDVHKRYTVFTRLDERGTLLGQGRVTNDAESLASLLAQSVEPAKVVLEAGGIWPVFTDALEDHAAEVVLAHPLKTRAIASARIKTDRIDSATLAHLLRTDLVPRAYLAPRSLREVREVLRYRVQLVRLRTAVKNRVHALLAMRGLMSPASDLFGHAGRRWLASLALPPVPRRAVDGFLSILDALNVQIRLIEREIRQRVRQSPEARRLWSIPGVASARCSSWPRSATYTASQTLATSSLMLAWLLRSTRAAAALTTVGSLNRARHCFVGSSSRPR